MSLSSEHIQDTLKTFMNKFLWTNLFCNSPVLIAVQSIFITFLLFFGKESRHTSSRLCLASNEYIWSWYTFYYCASIWGCPSECYFKPKYCLTRRVISMDFYESSFHHVIQFTLVLCWICLIQRSSLSSSVYRFLCLLKYHFH